MAPRIRHLAAFALAGALSWLAIPAPVQAVGPIAPVPAGFMWGVATAGHQYEGGDRHSNWARWVEGGHTPDRNPRAVDGYSRYEEDLDLAQELGLNTWRLSLEWSRIEPRPGQIDRAEVAHYHQVLEAIKARGMRPLVTLVHFSQPQWLDWEQPGAIDAFKRHVAFMAREFGRDVDWWLTFNEPNMLMQGAYANGFFPPGRTLDLMSALRVSRDLMAAHNAAYEVLHARDPGCHVSFNLYATEFQLFDADPLPKPSTEQWFVDRAKGHLDFACLDYYCRTTLVKPQPHEAWEVYPQGFTNVIKRYHAWTGLPVLIAENGLATRDLQPRQDGWTRGAYLVAHVKAMQQAMADGVPVLGYVHWSITDNYEWGSFTPRFGLYSVEARTGDLRRVPTDGVAAFRAITAAGGVDAAVLTRYGQAQGVDQAQRNAE